MLHLIYLVCMLQTLTCLFSVASQFNSVCSQYLYNFVENLSDILGQIKMFWLEGWQEVKYNTQAVFGTHPGVLTQRCPCFEVLE